MQFCATKKFEISCLPILIMSTVHCFILFYKSQSATLCRIMFLTSLFFSLLIQEGEKYSKRAIQKLMDLDSSIIMYLAEIFELRKGSFIYRNVHLFPRGIFSLFYAFYSFCRKSSNIREKSTDA